MRYTVHCILDLPNQVIALNPIAALSNLPDAKTLALQYSDDEPHDPPHPHAILDHDTHHIDFGHGFEHIPGFFTE